MTLKSNLTVRLPRMKPVTTYIQFIQRLLLTKEALVNQPKRTQIVSATRQCVIHYYTVPGFQLYEGTTLEIATCDVFVSSYNYYTIMDQIYLI